LLQIDPSALEQIAAANGWLHTRGRLKGTINAAAMADGIKVHRSTVLRAYDGGRAGDVLMERLLAVTDLPLGDIVRVVPEVAA